MASAPPRTDRGGPLRPCHRPALPARHQIPALAARQGARAMPIRPAPGRDAAGRDCSRAGRQGMSEEIEIDGVRLTSPDKVLYPEQGITKQALAEYYARI